MIWNLIFLDRHKLFYICLLCLVYRIVHEASTLYAGLWRKNKFISDFKFPELLTIKQAKGNCFGNKKKYFFAFMQHCRMKVLLFFDILVPFNITYHIKYDCISLLSMICHWTFKLLRQVWYVLFFNFSNIIQIHYI